MNGEAERLARYRQAKEQELRIIYDLPERLISEPVIERLLMTIALMDTLALDNSVERNRLLLDIAIQCGAEEI